MAEFSLVDTESLTVIREAEDFGSLTPPDFTGHPTKGKTKWVPYTQNVTPVNIGTQKAADPIVVISDTEHTVTINAVDLTQQELDDIENAKNDAELDLFLNGNLRATFSGLLNHENRLRALESEAPISKTDFKNLIKTFLNSL